MARKARRFYASWSKAFVAVVLLPCCAVFVSFRILIKSLGASPSNGRDSTHSVVISTGALSIKHQRNRTEIGKDNNYYDGFDWNDLNMTERAANCGMFKCFFRSISNETVGYLVAKAKKHYKPMLKSWDLAAELAEKYGAKHFYIQPPVKVSLLGSTHHRDDDQHGSIILLRRLQTAVNQPLRRVANSTLSSAESFFDQHDEWFSIQKVLRAPESSLVYGCCKCTSKMKALEQGIPAFRQHIADRKAFDGRLRRDRETVAKALHGHATLWFDFQGMIDIDGNFWFIDLDGPFDREEGLRRLPRRQTKVYVKKRLDYLDKIHRLLME